MTPLLPLYLLPLLPSSSDSARPFPVFRFTTTMGKHKHKHRVRIVLSDLEDPEFSLGALLGRSNSTGEDAR